MKKIPDDVRKDIPIVERYIYLDNAATGLTPKPVLDEMNRYYLEFRANIHRGVHRLSQQASLEYEEAHKKIARFIGAEEDEIAFTSGTTMSINLVALGLNLRKRVVVTTLAEHHSNLIPWVRLARAGKISLEFVRINKDGLVDLDDLERKARNAGLIAIHHVSNVLGTIQPIKEISKIAIENDSLLLLDAAQSVGHMPVNVKKLGVHFLAFSGHKGPLGPTGIGALYVKGDVQDMLKSTILGGGAVRDSDARRLEYELNDFPWGLEAGTPNIAGGIGLGSAVEYVKKVGVDKIEKHERKLAKKTVSGLRELGIEVYGPMKRAGVVSFNVPGYNPHEVAGVLDMHNIMVRSGHHCAPTLMKILGIDGSVRASYHCYNTKEEVEKMLEVLGELV